MAFCQNVNGFSWTVVLINIGDTRLFLGNFDDVVTCFSHKCTLLAAKLTIFIRIFSNKNY